MFNIATPPTGMTPRKPYFEKADVYELEDSETASACSDVSSVFSTKIGSNESKSGSTGSQPDELKILELRHRLLSDPDQLSESQLLQILRSDRRKSRQCGKEALGPMNLPIPQHAVASSQEPDAPLPAEHSTPAGREWRESAANGPSYETPGKTLASEGDWQFQQKHMQMQQQQQRARTSQVASGQLWEQLEKERTQSMQYHQQEDRLKDQLGALARRRNQSVAGINQSESASRQTELCKCEPPKGDEHCEPHKKYRVDLESSSATSGVCSSQRSTVDQASMPGEASYQSHRRDKRSISPCKESSSPLVLGATSSAKAMSSLKPLEAPFVWRPSNGNDKALSARSLHPETASALSARSLHLETLSVPASSPATAAYGTVRSNSPENRLEQRLGSKANLFSTPEVAVTPPVLVERRVSTPSSPFSIGSSPAPLAAEASTGFNPCLSSATPVRPLKNSSHAKRPGSPLHVAVEICCSPPPIQNHSPIQFSCKTCTLDQMTPVPKARSLDVPAAPATMQVGCSATSVPTLSPLSIARSPSPTRARAFDRQHILGSPSTTPPAPSAMQRQQTASPIRAPRQHQVSIDTYPAPFGASSMAHKTAR